MVYVTWEREGGHVWSIPIGGGDPTRLTQTPAFYAEPTVSPDGNRVVLRRGSRTDRLLMPAEFGGNPLPLDLVWLELGQGPQSANLIAPSRHVQRVPLRTVGLHRLIRAAKVGIGVSGENRGARCIAEQD